MALFIGYPRSGHTLISALLDAHPHIIIANEFGIFERWRKWRRHEKTRENLINKMYENSVREAQGFEFRSREKKRGQIYDVPDQWQGDFMNYIKVSWFTENLELNLKVLLSEFLVFYASLAFGQIYNEYN